MRLKKEKGKKVRGKHLSFQVVTRLNTLHPLFLNLISKEKNFNPGIFSKKKFPAKYKFDT